MTRRIRTAASAGILALGVVVATVLGFPGSASAHVTVNPKEAAPGSFARLAFRVPTESDTLSTTKLEVVLPEDAPVASVSIMPVPGWTATTEKRTVDPPVEVHGSQVTEVVAKITWTATADAAIKPGEFQEFPVSMGPLPDVDRMVFKALQTYSDGTVVRWIEEPPAGGGEVQSPAPVLTLAAASPAAPAATGSADVTAAEDTDRGDWVTVGTVVALVAGIAGLVLGALALARARRER